MAYKCPLPLTSHQTINVAVVGAGGNGSKLLSGLKHIALALRELRNVDFVVTVFDPDTVSTSNLIRQTFFNQDLGLNKAVALVHRFNCTAGLRWKAEPVSFTADVLIRKSYESRFHLVVSCVDNAEARREVWNGIKKERSSILWMDLGNGDRFGQVVLGNCFDKLPTVAELYPEILEDGEGPTQPSCSAFESIQRQDLFVNDTAAVHGLNLLWSLLFRGEINYQGVFFDVATGSSTPIPLPKTFQDPPIKKVKAKVTTRFKNKTKVSAKPKAKPATITRNNQRASPIGR